MKGKNYRKEVYTILLRLLHRKAISYGLNINDLEKYFTPEMIYFKQSNPLENPYLRLASSLQNSGMMHNSIKFNESDKRHQTIQTVLFDFNAKKVLESCENGKELYLKFIKNGIEDNGKKEKKETNWEKYSKGLYEGAMFLNSSNGQDLMNKVLALNNIETFDKSGITQIRKIAKEIHGLGFALTCDWLKECGCTWLAKPDVHIVDVYKAVIGLDEDAKVKESDVIEYMFNWAQELKSVDENMTAYKLDKIIWLICTGNFYLDKSKTLNKQTLLCEIKGINNT